LAQKGHRKREGNRVYGGPTYISSHANPINTLTKSIPPNFIFIPPININGKHGPPKY